MAEGGVTRLAGRPRPSRRLDGLALRRAMPDRLLPALVAAMTFLAALALAGAVGASLLAQRWSSGAAAVLTIQVPDGDAPASGGVGNRVDAVLGAITVDPAFGSATRIDQARLATLLAPWLGSGGVADNRPGGVQGNAKATMVDGEAGSAVGNQAGDKTGTTPGASPSVPPDALSTTATPSGAPIRGSNQVAQPWLAPPRVSARTPSRQAPPGTASSTATSDRPPTVAVPVLPALVLPAVIQARLRPGLGAPGDLEDRLDRIAPGTLVERNQFWTDRLVALTTSLQACAGLALLVVTGVAVAVVAAATRAGLAARRHSIEIVHGLGAGDGYIAGRFARRTTWLALSGGVIGTLLSIPLLLLLCRLGAPFAGEQAAVPPPADSGVADWMAGALLRVPLPLWIALPLLPPIAASIGWTTAQATVRTWLRRLP